jgi:hypothetical protein
MADVQDITALENMISFQFSFQACAISLIGMYLDAFF